MSRLGLLMTIGWMSLCMGATTGARAQDADYLFGLADANHDDEIDPGEAAAFAEIQWALIDPANKGTVTREGVANNPTAALFLGPLMPQTGSSISKGTFLSAVPTRFKAADRDGSGFLDQAEFLAFIGIQSGSRSPAVTSAPLKLQSLADAYPAGLPSCERLMGILAVNPGVTGLSVKRMAATPAAAAYCRVQFVYNSGKAGPKDGYDDGQRQAIGIRIGLPLRADDGGTSAWNGRIENLGSGGCMGNLPSVTVATNNGFAAASTDGGHGAPYLLFNCGFGVIQTKKRLNTGLIRDFTADHVIAQTLWSKAVVNLYYGQAAKRTYWSGCSQGGREGYIALQTVPGSYDGIVVGAGALYWMRFQMAQSWSGVVIKDMLRSKGKDLTAVQIAWTVKKEIAACDKLDGVSDGVLADPRTCHWSAKAVICGKSAPADGCLDADQARAFDVIRRGPRNHVGKLIWYPWEPGTVFPTETNYLNSDSVMQWAVHDLMFRSSAHLYMDGAALKRARDPQGITYEDMATLASRQASDLVDASNPSAAAAAGKSGVKVLAWTGTADRNIQSRNTIKFYRDVAAQLGERPGDERLADWYRLFLYPGVDHCQGGVGPQPGNYYAGPLFRAMIDWVELGRAPEDLLASKPGQSRPVCPYPKTAVYTGTGRTDDAENFVCQGDLETKAIIEQAQLAAHKRENGTGLIPAAYKDRVGVSE